MNETFVSPKLDRISCSCNNYSGINIITMTKHCEEGLMQFYVSISCLHLKMKTPVAVFSVLFKSHTKSKHNLKFSGAAPVLFRAELILIKFLDQKQR